jgi:tetratricopeptide (TPR) repeat protein/transcriptional regulator with XRE-family HTH domain
MPVLRTSGGRSIVYEAQPEPAPANFGAMLRRFRQRALLTQDELAIRTGLSPRTIRRLETAKLRRPRASTVRVLADQLQLTGDEQEALVAAADRREDRLRGPGADRPAEPPPRDELPAEITDFTGRSELVPAIAAELATDGAPGRGRLLGLSGAPGVGKTTLAVRVAHLLRAQFPDGRLYVDLRGLADCPMSPGEAVNRLLRWCRPSGSVFPEDLEERAALLRSTLADRRALIVLDNAHTEAQVRPLLPAGPSAVMLTSRRPMAALDGLVQYDLGLFQSGEAIGLLTRVLGAARVSAEPAAAREIVDLCGMLPLAIRIAGARLLSRPHWTLRRMADELADAHHRLDALAIGDRAVRSSVGLSYRTLGTRARRLLRLLGAFTAADVPAWVAAALLDVSPAEAEAVLDHLFDARLVEVHRAGAASGNRFGLHSLVRLYASERCVADDAEADRVAAARRLIAGWLYLAERYEARLPGGLPRIGFGDSPRRAVPADTTGDPMAWFECEHLTLAAAVRTACATGLDEPAWELAVCLSRFLEVSGRHDLWRSVLDSALDTVRRAGNRRGEAHLLRTRAELLADVDEYGSALECLGTALALFEELGEQRGIAHVERAIGMLERIRGDTDAATQRFERSLRVFALISDEVGLADTLFGLGALRREQGRTEEALGWYERALAHEERLGNLFNQSLILCSIGSTILAQGRAEDAREVLTRALALARRVGQGEGYALSFLGEAEVRAGDPVAASAHLSAALEIFRRGGDRYGTAVTLRNIGQLHCAQGALDEAIRHLDQALALWNGLDAPHWKARTLMALGTAQAARADGAAQATARAAWQEAAEIFGRLRSAEQQQAHELLNSLPAS